MACTLPQPGTYSALGYAYHLKGDVDAAIEQYHKVNNWWGSMFGHLKCGVHTSLEGMGSAGAFHPPAPRLTAHPATSLTQALGLRPEDAFTAEMLAEAMEESSAAFQATLEQM